jgi:hypothetical protein
LVSTRQKWKRKLFKGHSKKSRQIKLLSFSSLSVPLWNISSNMVVREFYISRKKRLMIAPHQTGKKAGFFKHQKKKNP